MASRNYTSELAEIHKLLRESLDAIPTANVAPAPPVAPQMSRSFTVPLPKTWKGWTALGMLAAAALGAVTPDRQPAQAPEVRVVQPAAASDVATPTVIVNVPRVASSVASATPTVTRTVRVTATRVAPRRSAQVRRPVATPKVSPSAIPTFAPTASPSAAASNETVTTTRSTSTKGVVTVTTKTCRTVAGVKTCDSHSVATTPQS